ncbi:MAG: 2-hydroxychromene-2-carboxylate isomerase [Alphaproteobacteria bacterium]|nr:MAG: 2-hydroxychromene-2-carboxylate isomerase [Alphaproteobacteria bacterium]
MKTIDFIFDFASPNAYLSHQLLPEIADRTGAKINYIPCLLGGIFKATGNQAPMVTFAPVKGKLDYQRLEMQRFVAKHSLTKFTMNPNFPVNTLIMMRAAIAAQEDGRLEDYIEAGLPAMWEDGKKMDDPEVFVAVMTKAGFDGASLLERTQDPAIKARLVENTAAAVDRGAFGIPTFYIGDEMFFSKDRLDLVEEALAE